MGEKEYSFHSLVHRRTAAVVWVIGLPQAGWCGSQNNTSLPIGS
jgi:hypothetical protein